MTWLYASQVHQQAARPKQVHQQARPKHLPSEAPTEAPFEALNESDHKEEATTKVLVGEGCPSLQASM